MHPAPSHDGKVKRLFAEGIKAGFFALGTDPARVRFRHDPKEGAVACIRLMLRCLLIVTVALGLASAPLYVEAQASVSRMGIEAHHYRVGLTTQDQADRDHASPTKPHAMGQTCCHPGCIMAIVPGFASLPPVPLPWVTIPIPRDSGVTPIAPMGPDRPPKRA